MLRVLGRWRRHAAPGQLELCLPVAGSIAPPPPGACRASSPQPASTPDRPLAPNDGIADPSVLASRFLACLRDLGLQGIRRCILTSNRSTVVSFRADRLRVQRALVDAPPGVLHAIVDFVNGKGAARRQARRALLAFELPRPPAGPRPLRRRREAPHPDDVHLVARLREAHQRLNHERFHGALGTVTIRVSRRMHSRLGHYFPGGSAAAPEIAIARRHIRRDGWTSAFDTLAHEMVHQWQHETARPLAHDRDFRCKAREVGIAPRAQRPPS